MSAWTSPLVPVGDPLPPVVAFDLEHVRVHTGLGHRLGKLSIVCRYTGEPLQVVTNPDAKHVESLMAWWDVFYDHAKKRASERR